MKIFAVIAVIFAIVILIISAWYTGRISGIKEGLKKGYDQSLVSFQHNIKKGIETGYTFWIGDIEFVPRKDGKVNVREK